MAMQTGVKSAVNRLLEKMVPDPQACRDAADKLRAAHPHESADQLARRAVDEARLQAMAVGAVTGLATTPITMVPAAVADMAAMLRIEGLMAGTIAALIDPEAVDKPTLRADLVGVIFPGAVSQVLRQVGVRAGEQTTKGLIRKYVTEDLAKTVVRLAARHVGVDLTRKAIMEKTVPLIGAGIGAGWNWVEVGAVGGRAVRYFNGEPLVGARVPGRFPLPHAAKEAALGVARGAAGATRRLRAVVKRITTPGEAQGAAGETKRLPAPDETEQHPGQAGESPRD
jgi:hypothetical protein